MPMTISVAPERRPLLRLVALEAAHRLDADGRAVEAGEEGFVVLLGEDGRGREDGGLASVHRGDECGAHRDLRLAVAGVAADEAVHRLGQRHVAFDVGDRLGLIRRLLVGESGLERRHALRRDVIGEAGHDRAAGLRLQERGGEILHRALGVRLVPRPALPVKAVELHRLALHAHVAGEQMRVGRRHVEARPVRIFDLEDLAPLPGHLDLGGSPEDADAVVDVDHVLARLQVQVLHEARPHRLRADRDLPPMGEDAVALRDDDEARHFESPTQPFVLDDEHPSLPCRGQIGPQTRPRRIEQFRAARRLHSQFRKTRQRYRLERSVRHAARRRIAGEDEAGEDGTGGWGGNEKWGGDLGRIGVVFQKEQRRTVRQGIQERREPPLPGLGRCVLFRDALDAHRLEQDRRTRPRACLEGRVERAKGFKVVPEELGAHGHGRGGRPGVQHAPAHGVLSGFRHLGYARIARRMQLRLQRGEGNRSAVGIRMARKTDRRRRGCRPRGEIRRERRHGRDEDERVRTQPIRAQHRRHLEPGRQSRAVVLQRWRELQRAHGGLAIQHPKVRHQRIRLGKARRDGKHAPHLLRERRRRKRPCGSRQGR